MGFMGVAAAFINIGNLLFRSQTLVTCWQFTESSPRNPVFISSIPTSLCFLFIGLVWFFKSIFSFKLFHGVYTDYIKAEQGKTNGIQINQTLSSSITKHRLVIKLLSASEVCIVFAWAIMIKARLLQAASDVLKQVYDETQPIPSKTPALILKQNPLFSSIIVSHWIEIEEISITEAMRWVEVAVTMGLGVVFTVVAVIGVVWNWK